MAFSMALLAASSQFWTEEQTIKVGKGLNFEQKLFVFNLPQRRLIEKVRCFIWKDLRKSYLSHNCYIFTPIFYSF